MSPSRQMSSGASQQSYRLGCCPAYIHSLCFARMVKETFRRPLNGDHNRALMFLPFMIYGNKRNDNNKTTARTANKLEGEDFPKDFSLMSHTVLEKISTTETETLNKREIQRRKLQLCFSFFSLSCILVISKMFCWVWLCLIYQRGLLADKEVHTKHSELNGTVITLLF